ncbi:lipopolysaccharide assembly protein LapB [Thalassomonas sp. M1454]|uniref:tetratricopeptide repeat protein n=1 Tax=Thalassomonas sp. M1454 TaxID=2594477 RepID=UPI00163D77BD|nr:tetratricopeptide repeat protein [Thalassomonas sp. M1454]
MKYIKIITVLLFSISLLSACSSTDDEQANMENYARDDLFGEKGQSRGITNKTMDEALASALEAEQRGDLDKALYYYIQCLEFEPDNSKVLYRIARIHDKQGNHSIAERAYKEALAKEPDILLAYQYLGIIQMQKKQYKQAQGYLQKAIHLDQKRLTDLGGKKEGGYYALDKASPTNSYSVSGIIEDMHHNFELARIYYNLALHQDENSANLLSNLGYSYYLTGDLTLAERYYRRAINVDTKFKRAWTNLGLVYARKGQYNRAIKTFKQVMPEFDAYNDLGYFVMLEGRLDEAEFFFQKAIDMSPSYFKKAYANLEQVQMRKRELWLAEQEAHGMESDEGTKPTEPVKASSEAQQIRSK